MSDSAEDGLLPASSEPVHVAARRLRWFRAAFRSWLDHQEEELGCAFELDEGVLAQIFVVWLRAVEAQRPSNATDRKAYFEFAAGLMLKELVHQMPIRVTTRPTRAGTDTSAGFWPEGHVCTMFCLAVARAALRQEFGDESSLAPEVADLRTWWSFRENAHEDPSTSVAFLELFLGREPDWLAPGVFAWRAARGPEPSPSPVGQEDTIRPVTGQE